MAEHYALRALIRLKKDAEHLNMYALVDGIQYERFFDEPLKDDKGNYALFNLPEDKALAFAGPWLLDLSVLSAAQRDRLSLLEKKYPAVSWIVSEHAPLTLAKHLASCLMVSLPSKEKGLFRFYDCRVLKQLPDLVSAEQLLQLMLYTRQWLFLSGGEIISYQKSGERIGMNVSGSDDKGKEEGV